MQTNQNIIHRSEFNFVYQSKASASRCNVLIESIFETHILPELEKAISNKVPEGVQIELSKLEIDIGKIEAKDLLSDLANRIRESLENALYPELDARAGLSGEANSKLDGRDREIYLLGALELFLTKGYFPFAMEGSATLDDLIVEAIRKNSDDILGLIKKYGRYDLAIKRISHTLKPKTIDQILFSLDPVNNRWINDFRQIMIYAKKEQSLSQFSDAEFNQILSYLILNYLLNETSQAFNRRKFAGSILNELLGIFNPDLPSLCKIIDKFTENTEAFIIVNETIAHLLKEGRENISTNEQIDSQSSTRKQNGPANNVDSGRDTLKAVHPVNSDLIDSIELLLSGKNYSPGTGNAPSLEKLISIALQQDRAKLLKLIKKHRRNDTTIKNIVACLSPRLFDQIVVLAIPVESKWILDYRKILISAQQKANFKPFDGEEFSQSLNSSILKYVLNRTGSNFNKEDFSALILKDIVDFPGFRSQSFFQAIQQNYRDGDIQELIVDTIENLQNRGVKEPTKASRNEMDIARLVRLLNEGERDFKTNDHLLLKQIIIEAITDRSYRIQLIERLNESGCVLILELFCPQRGKKLFKLIKSFRFKVTRAIDKSDRLGLMLATKKTVLNTVLYFNEPGIRFLTSEEFVLFLIYSSGLEDLETVRSRSFKGFIKKQKNIDLARIRALVNDEQKYPEISVMNRSLLNDQKTDVKDADKMTLKDSAANKLSAIGKQKIVGYFLSTGRIIPSFMDLTTMKVQVIFMDLIKSKNDFLFARLTKNDQSLNLISRLIELISTGSDDDLDDYFSHFFPEEHAMLSKLIGETRQQFKFRETSSLKEKRFLTELLIQALVAGDGGKSPGAFMFAVFERLKQELSGTSSDSAKLLQFFNSKSESGNERASAQKFYHAFKTRFREHIKNASTHDSNESIDIHHSTELEVPAHDPEIIQLVERAASNLKDQETDLSNVDKTTLKETSSNKYSTIYKRKIVGYFLGTGQLPRAYMDLTQRDVHAIFMDLITEKDDFLFDQLTNNERPINFGQRMNQLIYPGSDDDLADYFSHFFPEEYAVLSKLIGKIRQQFKFGAASPVKQKRFLTELLIRALVAGSGGKSLGVFMFAVFERLKQELSGSVGGSEELLQFLNSKSESGEEGAPEQKFYKAFKTGFGEQLKYAFTQNFEALIEKLHSTELEVQSRDAEILRLVERTASYFLLNASELLDFIREHRLDLLQIYTTFKFYLPRNQWLRIEKAFLSRTKFRIEIEKFEVQKDSLWQELSEPKTNLVETFDRIAAFEPEKLKAFVVLIQSNGELFERFISGTVIQNLPLQMTFGDQKILSYLNKLIGFAPSVTVGKIDLKFWRSVVLGLAFSIYMEGKKPAPADFAKTFGDHLKRKLKAVNAVRMFGLIVGKLNDSNQPELKEICNFLSKAETGEGMEASEVLGKPGNKLSDNGDFWRRIDALFFALNFYGLHDFFPWWAQKTSFANIIAELNLISQLQPDKFTRAFIQAEKEEHTFERLLPKLSGAVVFEMDQLISIHPSLQSRWRKIRRNHRNGGYADKQQSAINFDIRQFRREDFKNPELLFRALYLQEDEVILKHWFSNSPEVEEQLKSYLSITPEFHFRHMQPPQWRRAVFEFALDYYNDSHPQRSNRFAGDFFSFVQKKYPQVPLERILSTISGEIQSSPKRFQMKFPEDLKELLVPKQENRPDLFEPKKKLSDLFATDETGVEVKIDNSGLILFWPFLTMLFERLSLVENGNFVDQDRRNRAVYILQYLAYGDINFPEYELVLNKLLVGMPSEEYLVPFPELTNEEKEGAQSLLNGLIANWEKVKHSSPEAIQETFLQREGILRFQKDHVSLEVQKKGVDVLLSSIPWNISMVKLSWMTKPIHVKWS